MKMGWDIDPISEIETLFRQTDKLRVKRSEFSKKSHLTIGINQSIHISSSMFSTALHILGLAGTTHTTLHFRYPDLRKANSYQN